MEDNSATAVPHAEDPCSPTDAPVADVVETDFLEPCDSGPTVLVEGDFFPETLPADAGLLVQLEAGDVPSIASSSREGSVLSSTSELGGRKSSSAAHSSRCDNKTRVRRRAVWADKDFKAASAGGLNPPVSHLLVRHVTTFYMTHSSHVQSYRSTEGENYFAQEGSSTTASHATAPSIFREKENVDGSVYLFCRAQRPAARFVQWRRELQADRQAPFALQPNSKVASSRTLFAALYPNRLVNNGVRALGRSALPPQQAPVLMRVAQRADEASRCPQMPFIRAGAAYDEPLLLPTIETVITDA